MSRPTFQDTIVALSTPPGIGGIAVVRLSGENSTIITNKMLGQDRQISSKSNGKAVFSEILDPSTGDPIDDIIVTYFKAPNSYTTDDVVELSCHGGLYVQDRILKILLGLGARMAEPGEFTKRAFLGGRIDLTQAEAVADLIAAKVESSHKSSMLAMHGNLKSKAVEIRSILIDIAALIEAELDFSEDEIDHTPGVEIAERINLLLSVIEKLLSTYTYGKILKEGALIPIIGKPNVGKSSLLNAIVKQERAIVTPSAGTTRDTIEEQVDIGGYLVRLVDTAGVRDINDPIENIGISRSLDAIGASHIIIWLLDRSTPIDKEDIKIKDLLGDKNYLAIESKNDLEKDRSFDPANHDIEITASISTISDNGIESLTDLLAQTIKSTDTGEGAIITNARLTDALERGKTSLKRASGSSKSGAGGEFVASDIRDAMDHLGEITGEITTEEILNDIFGKFCIGK